ncbi:hypothetical protein GCM10011492_09520 [Flexivirga endophytica]|uniref:Rv3651-like C-terminal domain-containing protein n=1 Tax=Flexivirga endophytica TaxID=1849103 RepID=A0A916SXQ5_9MICO|nr:hypothetical protein GCM10011492_09520 [Flexivirga endophytica]GHB59337.1 hypothetical protein GCM10008112_30540 [Flexivirga endophytica]
MPLDRFFARSRTSLGMARTALEHVAEANEPCDMVDTAGRRCIAHPLSAYDGQVNGAWLWLGHKDEPEPATPHDPAGAWYFNLTNFEVGGSDELLDLYRQPNDQRRTKRAMGEAFTRLTAGPDASEALAKIVQSRPGSEHQAVWTVVCDDGDRRAAHFSCRAVLHSTEDGPQIIMHGITHDIGPADDVPQAPHLAVLERRVLDAAAQPGTHRAIVDVRTGHIIQWIDAPPSSIDWAVPGIDIFHPDDAAVVHHLNRLGENAVTASLRLRCTDVTWISVIVTSQPMLLNNSTTAALWTIDVNSSLNG